MTLLLGPGCGAQTALDPSNGGRSITVADLRPGDVIFSTTPSWGSAAIRRFTNNGPASHVRLYIGKGFVIESEPGIGVAPQSVTEAISKDSYDVAFRVEGITSGESDAAVAFAWSQVGKTYSYWGAAAQVMFAMSGRAATVNLGADDGRRRSYFCSELVLAAFAAAGVELATVGNASPNGIVPLTFTGSLNYVGHLKSGP